MSGIEITSSFGKVTIVVRVGTKNARLTVTPEYARKLAGDLAVAAAQSKSADDSDSTLSWLERLRKAVIERP